LNGSSTAACNAAEIAHDTTIRVLRHIKRRSRIKRIDSLIVEPGGALTPCGSPAPARRVESETAAGAPGKRG